LGLLYRADASIDIVGYSDADWVGEVPGEVMDRKSTFGNVFSFAISWKSTKQTTMALFTADAQYTILATVSQEAIWLQQLMNDLTRKTIQKMTIFEDNHSAI